MPGKSDWKGHLAAQKVELRAAEKGVVCSNPSIPCRYDRILDVDGKLVRVQVKYAARKPSHSVGAVSAKLYHTTRAGKDQVYQRGEVDALLVYIPHIDKVLWFPEDVFIGKKFLNIRYEPAKNGQTKGCLMAEEYHW